MNLPDISFLQRPIPEKARPADSLGVRSWVAGSWGSNELEAPSSWWERMDAKLRRIVP